MKLTSLLILSLFFANTVFASNTSTGVDKRERLIGNIVKNALETYHYKDLKIDDKLSRKAFKEFLKKIDYSKQFLLQSDVEELIVAEARFLYSKTGEITRVIFIFGASCQTGAKTKLNMCKKKKWCNFTKKKNNFTK